MGLMPIMALLHTCFLVLSIYANLEIISHCLMSLLINCIMFFNMSVGLGWNYAVNRMKKGQLLPSTLYIFWLLIFPQSQLIYLLPLVFSNIGKCYLMFNPPQNLDIQQIEQVIVREAKFQIIIIFYVFMRMLVLLLTLRLTMISLFSYVLLLLIFKLKYEIHYGTRKAYQEIHFILDRIFKHLNMRSLYHSIHNIVSLFGGVWSSSKQIAY